MREHPPAPLSDALSLYTPLDTTTSGPRKDRRWRKEGRRDPQKRQKRMKMREHNDTENRLAGEMPVPKAGGTMR